jgi:BASS family bile acid:Na+ symporter
MGELLTNVFLPLSIVLIMIAVGMTLTGDDLRRLTQQRKAVAVGLFCQLIVLPVLAFFFAWAFGLATIFAIGMILLAASPGGSTSNLIIHISDGDRPLSLTLTTMANLVVFATMPLLIRLAERVFGQLDGDARVPLVALVIQVAGLTVIPVLIGAAIRWRSPGFADRAEGPGKRIATIVFVIIVALLIVDNWDRIADEVPRFGPAFISLNLAALAAGWGIARAAGVTDREATAIGLETGMQNTTVAITVALAVFDSEDLAIIPALYGIWMFVTGLSFAFVLRSSPEPAAALDG